MFAAEVNINFLVHPCLALKVCRPFSRTTVPALSQYHTISTASPLSLLVLVFAAGIWAGHMLGFFQWLKSSPLILPGPSGSRLRWGSLAVTGSHEVGGKHHGLGFHKGLFALHTTFCERMHLMVFPPLFFSLFSKEFLMGDQQIKFKSVSHTLLPSQRCNLGQISVSASDVGIVTPIAQSLASLYFYLVCVF